MFAAKMKDTSEQSLRGKLKCIQTTVISNLFKLDFWKKRQPYSTYVYLMLKTSVHLNANQNNKFTTRKKEMVYKIR